MLWFSWHLAGCAKNRQLAVGLPLVSIANMYAINSVVRVALNTVIILCQCDVTKCVLRMPYLLNKGCNNLVVACGALTSMLVPPGCMEHWFNKLRANLWDSYWTVSVLYGGTWRWRYMIQCSSKLLSCWAVQIRPKSSSTRQPPRNSENTICACCVCTPHTFMLLAHQLVKHTWFDVFCQLSGYISVRTTPSELHEGHSRICLCNKSVKQAA